LRRVYVHLALLAVAFLYAFNYVIAKFATPEYILPFGLVVIRAGGTTILFWILYFFMKKEKIRDKKDYWKFAYCAIFGIVINQLMFFKGLSLTSPINASIIITMTPIVVLIASAILLKEKITWLKVLGIILGLGGAIGIILQSTKTGAVQGNAVGDIFIVVNAFSYAIYLVLVKPLLLKYRAITVIRWLFTFGFIGILPFGFQELLSTNWEAMPNFVYWILAYIVVGVTFGVYLLNGWALQYVNATLVSVYIYLQPLLTTIFALALNQDSLNLTKILFALLIFLGVYLVNRPTKKVKVMVKA